MVTTGTIVFCVCVVLNYFSPEIRELEAKLRAGYTNKERAVQLLEKEAIREQEKVIHWVFLCCVVLLWLGCQSTYSPSHPGRCSFCGIWQSQHGDIGLDVTRLIKSTVLSGGLHV